MRGRVLAERYELLEPLGSGGMASVWRAADRSLGRRVAIKILHPNLAADAAFVERFRREARHAASLAHPNVVAVYDSGTEDGTPFIVMELVEGMSLHTILATSGPLAVAHTARVGRQVLAALDHAHQRGLVHRDVKPGNVLVTVEGAVKVTDFGIAKGLEDAAALTLTGTMLGTASYISPEQAAGGVATAASDIYAVGCVLYECLAGRPPFTGENPVAVALQHQRAAVPRLGDRRPDVPLDLEAVVHRALEKDPGRRFPTAAAMDSAIEVTGLDRAPDASPTLAMVPEGAAPTVRIAPSGTQVLPGRPAPPPNRMGRFFAWAGIVLLILAMVWLGVTMARLLAPSLFPTPTPTVTPTPTRRPPTSRPTPPATPTPSPVATPEPELTPEPEVTPTPFIDLPGLRNENPGRGRGPRE